jgi:hypothetical protein
MTTKGLEKAAERLQEMRTAGITIEVETNLIRKAQADPKSLRKAINAMCFACFGGTKADQPDPGWRDMIRTCTSPQCPLWPHRPYRTRDDEDGARIRSLSSGGDLTP